MKPNFELFIKAVWQDKEFAFTVSQANCLKYLLNFTLPNPNYQVPSIHNIYYYYLLKVIMQELQATFNGIKFYEMLAAPPGASKDYYKKLNISIKNASFTNMVNTIEIILRAEPNVLEYITLNYAALKLNLPKVYPLNFKFSYTFPSTKKQDAHQYAGQYTLQFLGEINNQPCVLQYIKLTLVIDEHIDHIFIPKIVIYYLYTLYYPYNQVQFVLNEFFIELIINRINLSLTKLYKSHFIDLSVTKWSIIKLAPTKKYFKIHLSHNNFSSYLLCANHYLFKTLKESSVVINSSFHENTLIPLINLNYKLPFTVTTHHSQLSLVELNNLQVGDILKSSIKTNQINYTVELDTKTKLLATKNQDGRLVITGIYPKKDD